MAALRQSLLAATCVMMAGALSAPSALAHHSAPQSAKAKKWPSNLQCVPYAREMSGIQIYGDAHTWWGQAAKRYARGSTPHVGAVMAFKPHRGSRLGHVAYVSKIVDSRNILISHSNWSLINGKRGQIERNVPARDVSPNNDWSEVRVWYHQTGDLGGTHWPLHGFIYKAEPGSQPKPRLAAAATTGKKSSAKAKPAPKIKRPVDRVAAISSRADNGPVRIRSSKEFADAFVNTEKWLASDTFRSAFGPNFKAD